MSVLGFLIFSRTQSGELKFFLPPFVPFSLEMTFSSMELGDHGRASLGYFTAVTVLQRLYGRLFG